MTHQWEAHQNGSYIPEPVLPHRSEYQLRPVPVQCTPEPFSSHILPVHFQDPPHYPPGTKWLPGQPQILQDPQQVLFLPVRSLPQQQFPAPALFHQQQMFPEPPLPQLQQFLPARFQPAQWFLLPRSRPVQWFLLQLSPGL